MKILLPFLSGFIRGTLFIPIFVIGFLTRFLWDFNFQKAVEEATADTKDGLVQVTMFLIVYMVAIVWYIVSASQRFRVDIGIQ